MLKKKIAIINQWPEVPNAEKETVQRIKASAHAIGLETVIMDKLGYDLETGKEITSDEVDFVIHLHFETPKCYDIYSYGALWNPLTFYYDWGYHQFSEHMATHDDFLSCSSKWADDHIIRQLERDPKRCPPLFKFHHSLSGPIIAPSIKADPRIFYCGINWERITGNKGRFDDLLKLLDKENLIKIYGPLKLQGKKVWSGFKNYVMPIPFDGKTVVEEIAKCGISLVFSSEAHKQSMIMSSRLYESAAAGAVIIADDNPFVKEHFGDSVLYVKDSKSTNEINEQVIAHYRWIKNNPLQALELAKKSQAIFLKYFNQKNELSFILDNHLARKQQLEERILAQSDNFTIDLLHIFYSYDKYKVEKFIKSLEKQTYRNFKLFLYVNEEDTLDGLDSIISQATFPISITKQKLISSTGRVLLSIGMLTREFVSEGSKSALLHVSAGNIEYFHNHLSLHVRCFEDNPNTKIVFGDVIYQHWDEKNKEFRDYAKINSLSDLLSASMHTSLPFLVKTDSFPHEYSIYTDYLDNCLPVFWSQLFSHPNSINYIFRISYIKRLDSKEKYLLSSNKQLKILSDKFSQADSGSWLTLGKLWDNASNFDKKAFAEAILKHIPINSRIKKVLVKAYKTLIRSKESN